MFSGCSSLTRIIIPDGVTSIGSSAFSGCSSLTSITIPNGVTNIGEQTFHGCSSLTSITIPDGVTSIGSSAFSGCSSLTRIIIPDSVTSIGEQAFYNCSGLTSIMIPNGVTNIGNQAFCMCYNLYRIVNYSDLMFTIGSDDNGGVAAYAELIIDKNGNKTYRDESYGFEYIDTIDGFRFVKANGEYKLTAYLGNEDTVILPIDINGNSYSIYQMHGIKNVIIPDGITSIGQSAFDGCSSLTSITIPNSVKSIGSGAFSGCSSLTSITIPDGITSIGQSAFYDCSSLTSITISDSVTSIGNYAFQGTAFYNNSDNWSDDCLYIGKHLVSVAEDAEMVVVRPDTITIAAGAFEKCHKLTSITMGGNQMNALFYITNLEMLILKELPTEHYILNYFGWDSSFIPITFKNVVLKKGCNVTRSDMFFGISGVTVYVEDSKENCPWNEVFSGWNNGNKVYYGGEWINAEFRDADGKLITSDYYTTSQVVRQPYVASVPNGRTKFVFAGWDLDGDGIADPMPATSGKNISATAVMKEVPNTFTVSYLGFDGENLYKQTYVYGDTIVLPDVPQKKGYVFDGWLGFVDGMTIEADISFESRWIHDRSGHVYDVSTVAPTCDEQGYDKHVCSICDHEWHDNFVDALGHNYGDWTLTTVPTCTDEGLQTRTCLTCGHEETQSVAAVGHDFVITITKAATCTHEGSANYVCATCGHTEVQAIETIEHSYHKHVVPKSWLRMLLETIANIFFGYEGNNAYYYKCDMCGKVMASDGVSAMSSSAQSTCIHQPQDWQVTLSPSCQAGLEARICSLCGKAVEVRTTKANGEHVLGDWYVKTAPDCIHTGVEHRDCVYCDHFEERELTSLGHDLIHHDSKAATCTEIGWNEYDTCSRCDYTTYSEIAAKGHTKGNAVEENRIEATCTGDGHYDSVVYCSICNEELSRTQETLQKLGHDLVHHEGKAATCTEKGWNEYDTCSRCDYITYSEIAAKGHAEVVDKAVAPTCTETGLTEGKHCSVCGEVLVAQQVVSALGHDMGEWQQTKAPGCTEVGEERRDCSRCDRFETRELVAPGHDLIHHDNKAATCTEKGWNEYDTCSRCDYTTYSEIAAKGHTEVVDEAVAPTCTETGLTEGKHCSVCGEVLVAQRVVEALGHSETDWIVDKEATCNEVGSKHKECSVCHEHLATEIIAAHGHEFGEWTTVTEPTTKSEGKMTRTCKLCGEQEEKTIDKLPKQGCFGSISNVGGVVATVSILAVVVFVVRRKRKI